MDYLGNVSSTVSLLERFGEVKVLSTPTVVALNNQMALIKVVRNIVYFTMEVEPGQTSNGVTTPATFSTEPHTVPVGFTMAVIPQISGNNEITLIVRPTLTRLVDYKQDPHPELAAQNVVSEVPVIDVREMESILRVPSGNIAVIGGLMQESVDRSSSGLPLLSKLPGLGHVFSSHDDQVQKTELVVLLRPTVINSSVELVQEIGVDTRTLEPSQGSPQWGWGPLLDSARNHP
ncbi:MAG: type II and III secretion system protein [Magnetococcus sp. WYHC-3]